MSRSVYRFLSSPKPGNYSVQRGDTWLGHVAKQSYRHTERGRTLTIVSGWLPSDRRGRDLPLEVTRELAAQALWRAYGEQL